jgi:hypothetical protein
MTDTTRVRGIQCDLCVNAQTGASDCCRLSWVGFAGCLSLVFAGERRLAVERQNAMLYTIAVILLIAWLLGLVGPFTIGPILHVLLVIAIVLFVVGLVSGRRTLA